MELISKSSLISISGKTEVYDFFRKVLHAGFPVALWRLPKSKEHFILIDIRQNPQESPIENMDQCFIINPYGASHPPKPVALSGDIIIKLHNENAETQISPSLSANDLDKFFESLNNLNETLCEGKEDLLKAGKCSDFQELVKSGVEKIKSGEAEKIVLSRYQDHDLSDDFDPLNVYDKLTETYPNAFCHMSHTAAFGLWIGATPEKMIAIENEQIFSTDALAGTQPLQKDSDLGELAWTQKEIEEQAMVSRYIISCFKKIRLREYDEIGPKTVRAGNLAHLKTEFKVDMLATNSPLLGSTMLNLLHPTSAVCGHPRTVANDFIQEMEGYDRELFAGFLGPVGFGGNTHLFVNLRCMKVSGSKARLFAGAGITECSDPRKEFFETQYKMQTLLQVLGT